MRRSLLVLLLALVAASCQPRKVSPPDSVETGVLDAALVEASEVLTLDPEQSSFELLVFRAGALAGLGHNHVLSAPKLEGTVYRHPNLTKSQFRLQIGVDDLVVDDPQLRADRGEAFASEPSQADIAGTRRNMLGEDLLHGAVYPQIRVLGRGIQLTGEQQANVDLTIAIKDVLLTRTVPVFLGLEPDRVTASGTITLTHSELGLRPFSVMLGALQVAEEMTLEFKLVGSTCPPGQRCAPR